MSNTSYECPSGWMFATFNGLRVCGRPISSGAQTCTSNIFSTGSMQYNQVCGQARGYQYGDPVAFAINGPIDGFYVDGLTLTHGASGSRQHIWTFANGLSEDRSGRDACPCAPNFGGTTVPSFVGSNYFCESGTTTHQQSFHAEPLWDGSGCSLPGNTCCTFNSPPYFSVQLPEATSDDIEGRICGYDTGTPSAGNTYISFLELYIK